MLSSRAGFFLKLLTSTSIIIFIVSQIDWQLFAQTLKKADIILLFFVFLLLWVERGWAVFKWQYLLRAQGGDISLWSLFCVYNIGTFWGVFLPSSLSTDVVRGYYLSQKTKNVEMAAASVVVDRMMGLFSLLFCCLVSVMVYSSTFSKEVTRFVLVLTFGCALATPCAFLQVVPDFLERRIPFFTRYAIGRKLIGMQRSFLSYRQYPLVMLISFFNSLILQVIRAVTMYYTALAFQVDVELVKFFIIVPVTVIVIMIPVSIGGLGVREGSFVSLFGLVGLGLNESFAIAGTNSIMVTVVGLLGGVFYLSFKNEKQQTDISLNSRKDVACIDETSETIEEKNN